MDWLADELSSFAYIVRLCVAKFLGRPIIEVVRRVRVKVKNQ